MDPLHHGESHESTPWDTEHDKMAEHHHLHIDGMTVAHHGEDTTTCLDRDLLLPARTGKNYADMVTARTVTGTSKACLERLGMCILYIVTVVWMTNIVRNGTIQLDRKRWPRGMRLSQCQRLGPTAARGEETVQLEGIQQQTNAMEKYARENGVDMDRWDRGPASLVGNLHEHLLAAWQGPVDCVNPQGGEIHGHKEMKEV